MTRLIEFYIIITYLIAELKFVIIFWERWLPCIRRVKAVESLSGVCRTAVLLNYLHMFYTYVLISQKDNNFYVGSTSDLRRRIKDHNAGMTKSIKHRRPFKLAFYEAYNSREEASNREKFLKSSDGKKDIRKRLLTI